MGSAKFQVNIKDINEDQLGPLLGALPNWVHPEIMRTNGRTAPLQKVPPVTKEVTIPRPSTVQGKFGPHWFHKLPNEFRAKDLVSVIEANGFNGNSINHFIRRAVDANLIKKVAGTQGTATRYQKV